MTSPFVQKVIDAVRKAIAHFPAAEVAKLVKDLARDLSDGKISLDEAVGLIEDLAAIGARIGASAPANG